MSVEPSLLAGIESQLADDILHFGWLRQIVGLQNPQRSDGQCVRIVLDAVTHLHCSGAVVVGDARDVDGVVLIDPWLDATDELRARMESAVDHSDDNERAFCFWIQPRKDFIT